MVSSVNSSTGTSIVNSLTGSSIDIGALTKSLVEATRAPQQAILDAEKKIADSKVSAIGRIYASANTMKTAIASFGDPKALSMQPQTTDATRASFVFRSYYTPTAFDITMTVKQLATANTVTLNGVSSTDTFPTSGTLKINSGQRDSATAATVATFDYADYTSLEELRDAIKADGNYDATIMTSVTSTGTTRYLTISNGSGEAKNFHVTTTDSSSADLTTGLYITPPVRDADTLAITSDVGQASGQDAQVVSGGVTYSSPSNRFSSFITGAFVDVKATTAVGETVQLSAVRDMTKYKEAVASIVKNYNELLGTVTQEITYDRDVQKRGGLANDSVARGFLAQMRRMTTQSITTIDDADVTLAQVGVKTGRDGTLSIDTALLEKVASEQPEILEAVMASTSTTTGILERMNTLTDVVLGRTSDFVKMYDRTTKVVLPKIQDKTDKLNSDMDALQARYLKQFTAMQEIVNSSKASSESLTSSMSAWTASLKG